MFCAFFSLLMLCGGVGVCVWLLAQRITAHMRSDPEFARLFAQGVITPLLTGGKKSEDEVEPADEPPAGDGRLDKMV